MSRHALVVFVLALTLSLQSHGADWTLFFYISANTGHSRELAQELKATHARLVREHAPNEAINVVTLFDSPDANAPAVFEVSIQGRARPDLRREYRQLNMGDGRTLLSEFLAPGLSATKTEKNALFILGHGAGWAPADPPQGASPDAGFLAADAGQGDDGLTPTELRDALATAARGLPRGKFDLIAFHACDMSSFEMGYQLRHVAEFMLAPDGTLPKRGLAYPSLSKITSTTSGSQLATWIIEDTQKMIARHSELRCGLALCDLSMAETVADALDAFVASAMVAMADSKHALTLADLYDWHRRLARPHDVDMVTLFRFIRASYPRHGELQVSASRVLAALERYQAQIPHQSRIAIMFPSERTVKSLARDADEAAKRALARYAALDFGRERKWFSLVEHMIQAQHARATQESPR